jgi:c-di-GMP-binding flagellar brake protein YcgR
MLEPGTHLECQILHKDKNVVFMSNVLDSNETELMLKPPKVKSRPANMKQFKELQCRIRRENDADYEFKLKIIGQLVRDLNAVILEHTSNIRRLHIRNSERLQLDLEMEFEMVTGRQFEMERQLDLGKGDYVNLSGIVKDMSAGGIKVQLKELPSDGIKREDVFIFHLPYASLHKKLAVSVLDLVSNEGLTDVHCEFLDVDMLTRMKINQYLHRRKLSMEAA